MVRLPEGAQVLPDAEAVARLLDLRQVAAGLGAGLVQVLERGARQLELAGGLQADAAVVAGERNDVGAVGGGLLDRAPAVAGQVGEEVADAAGLVVGRGVVVTPRVDELLVLGADPPAVGGLLAAREAGDQLVARLDDRRGLASCLGRIGRHEPRLTPRREGGKARSAWRWPPAAATSNALRVEDKSVIRS